MHADSNDMERKDASEDDRYNRPQTADIPSDRRDWSLLDNIPVDSFQYNNLAMSTAGGRAAQELDDAAIIVSIFRFSHFYIK